MGTSEAVHVASVRSTYSLIQAAMYMKPSTLGVTTESVEHVGISVAATTIGVCFNCFD